MPAANVIIKQNMRDFLSNMKTTNIMESATSVMDVIFKGTTEGIFDKHVETIPEGVHYTCSQWDYKATTNSNQ